MIRMVLCSATGRMGGVIRALVSERDDFILSHAVAPPTTFSSFDGEADVAVDFSTPEALTEELLFCVERKL